MNDSTSVKVKIGVTFAPREIEISVDDVDGFVSEFEAAMSSPGSIWWVTDSTGRRHGLVVDKVSYVDIEAVESHTIGFG